jgi:glycosyltransferase involved in cell wall biosynthesis
MRHIAILTTSYPDTTPGSEAAGSFVEDFARELSDSVRVTVVTASFSDSISTTGNLTVRRFAVPKLPLSLLNPMWPNHWISIIVTLRRGLETVKKLATEDKPDHIFALWALPCGYWANAVAREFRIPYSVWALGSDIWGLGKLPLVRAKLRHVLLGAHACYADGFQLGKEVENISGSDCRFLPSTRRMVLPLFPQLSHNPPYKLAFLGRWHPNKGVDILLDALARLTDADWEKVAEIRIFGGGQLADMVTEMARKLQIQGWPVVLGSYLDKEQASELIGWADYLMLPSRIESIPVIFSDAAKLGTPIVSTPVGDLPRLYQDYQFGVLAVNISPAAFCKAIQSALSRNPADFLAGLERVRQDFDLPGIVDEFLGACRTWD